MRSLVAVAGLVLVAGLVTIATQLQGTDAPDDDLAEPVWEVELPDEDSDRIGEDPPPDTPVSFPAADARGCEPDGCEAWRTRLGSGGVLVADDLIVHTSASDVQAVDVATGATRWSWRYAELGIPPIVDGAQPHRIGYGRVAVTFADGGLQLRDLATGRRAWHVDLELDHIDQVAAHGEVVVLAGWTQLTREVQVIALAAATGEERWRQRVDRAVSIDADPLLLLDTQRAVLVGADPDTGQLRWARPADGPLSALAGDHAHALVSPVGVEAIDPDTGETLLRLPRPVTHAGPTRLVGRLLLTNLPASGGLSGPDRAEVRFGDVVSGTTGTLAQVTGLAAVDDMVVVVQQNGTELTLLGLAADGTPRWERPALAPDDVCCWIATPGPDDGTVLIVPPSLEREPVRAVDAATGDTVASFRRPRGIEREQLEWSSGLGVDRDDERTVFIGPHGTVSTSPRTRLLTTTPRPVLLVDQGLLGLDPVVLFGAPPDAVPGTRPDPATGD